MNESNKSKLQKKRKNVEEILQTPYTYYCFHFSKCLRLLPFLIHHSFVCCFLCHSSQAILYCVQNEMYFQKVTCFLSSCSFLHIQNRKRELRKTYYSIKLNSVFSFQNFHYTKLVYNHFFLFVTFFFNFIFR